MDNKKWIPIGMIFQFLFTVIGGGLLVSGLIAGFSLHWDMSGDDIRARIALLMAIFGGILFTVGVLMTVFLLKIAKMSGPAGEDKTDAEKDDSGEDRS